MPSRPPALVALLVLVAGCTPGEGLSGPVTTTSSPQAATSPSPGAAASTAPGAAPSPSPGAATSSPEVAGPAATRPPCPTAGAVDSATWTQAEGGRSLAVVPGEQLRGCAGPLVRWDGIPPGWADVLALAGPEADSPAMAQQYVCHLRFARTKETWNLEPWRPEVAEEDLLRALCNPEGTPKAPATRR